MIYFSVTGHTDIEAFAVAQQELAQYHSTEVTRFKSISGSPLDIRVVMALLEHPVTADEYLRPLADPTRLVYLIPLAVKEGRAARWMAVTL